MFTNVGPHIIYFKPGGETEYQLPLSIVNDCTVYKQYGTHEIQIKKSNEQVIVAWCQNEQFLQLNFISWLNQVTFKQQDNTDDSTCIIR